MRFCQLPLLGALALAAPAFAVTVNVTDFTFPSNPRLVTVSGGASGPSYSGAAGEFSGTLTDTVAAAASTQGSALRFGVGPSGGVRARLADNFVLLGIAGWQYLPLATIDTTYRLELGARVGLGSGFALGGQVVRTPLATEGSLSAMAYF